MYLKEEKYSFHILEMLRYAPAVFIEGHDEALVLDAGNRGVVAVLACEDLLSAIFLLATDVRVLRPVEPEERHHHLPVLVLQMQGARSGVRSQTARIMLDVLHAILR